MTHRHRITLLVVPAATVVLVAAAMASGAGRQSSMTGHHPAPRASASASTLTRTTTAVFARGPQAHVASVNSPISFVSLSFFFHGFSDLKGFELYPYYHRYYYPY